MAVMKPAVVGCLWHIQRSVSGCNLAKPDFKKVGTDLAFCNSLFDFFHLDLAHALDLVQCLACCSMDRLFHLQSEGLL
jgi:hypothetical protein